MIYHLVERMLVGETPEHEDDGVAVVINPGSDGEIGFVIPFDMALQAAESLKRRGSLGLAKVKSPDVIIRGRPALLDG